MTAREIYEGVLISLNKVHAPALTVEEFNYLLNKSILAYPNERYNFYAVNQQLSDDLRVLLKPYVFAVTSGDIIDDLEAVRHIEGAFTENDYFHIISCDLIVKNMVSNKTKRYVIKRMTLDMYGAIYNNEYLKPALHRPYFLLTPSENAGEQNMPSFKIFIGDPVTNLIPTAVRLVYLRLPVHVTLTEDHVYNMSIDSSPVLEFPDYLKNEFIKRIAWDQLENTRDQRAGTFPSLNQEIPQVPLELMGGSVPQTQSTQT
jgi:hypothetical protein